MTRSRLQDMDAIMCANMCNNVHDGSSSFFFKDWTGDGSLVDWEGYQFDVSLCTLAIWDVFYHSQWDYGVLQELLSHESVSRLQLLQPTFDG